MMDPVTFASLILNTRAQVWNQGQPMFLAVDHMDEAQLSDLVTKAETDFRTYEYLRAWLAGELGHRVPAHLPAALTPFIQRLAARKGPDGRGKKTPPPPKALVRACAEALKSEYSCPIYSTKMEDTACDYIGQALGLTPARVKRLLQGP